ncbi:MAG: HlyD family efflux transporter periplasmic adaptor subunit [Eubacterium sp.]|nr:HlyD family efflux transporter periplasmic adaptor subunit [Eubacterium sp.]
MKKKGSNKKRVIIIAIVAAAAAVFLLWWFLLRDGARRKNQEVAYVQTVAEITGLGDSAGLVNRYAGVVEAQESWSVKQDSDATVKEILVKVGDSVKKGDPLLTYDVDKFQSDLEQAQIEQERLQNELQNAKDTVEQLQKEKAKAKASEQASYTIQIKEQELTVKQTELDIESKKLNLDKLKNNIEHATVTSEIDGVVKSINNGETDEDSFSEGDSSLITIMQTGDLRVKGTINEQNITSLGVGAELLIHSRTDAEKVWHGVISKVDTENTNSDQNNNMYFGDSGSGSTSYPFYVSLESSEGLMIGQHVYMELDYGQDEVDEKTGVWMYDYMIDMTDASHPFVWADNNGKLAKREVGLGAYDEEMMMYEITSGLALEDSIAMPDERLYEGMATKPMSEMEEDIEEGGSDEDIVTDDEDIEVIDDTDDDDGEAWDGEDLDPDYEEDDEEDDGEDWGTEEGFQGMDGYQSMEGMDRGDPSMDNVVEDPEDSIYAEDVEDDADDDAEDEN